MIKLCEIAFAIWYNSFWSSEVPFWFWEAVGFKLSLLSQRSLCAAIDQTRSKVIYFSSPSMEGYLLGSVTLFKAEKISNPIWKFKSNSLGMDKRNETFFFCVCSSAWFSYCVHGKGRFLLFPCRSHLLTYWGEKKLIYLIHPSIILSWSKSF